jgi:hypothetical protein
VTCTVKIDPGFSGDALFVTLADHAMGLSFRCAANAEPCTAPSIANSATRRITWLRKEITGYSPFPFGSTAATATSADCRISFVESS